MILAFDLTNESSFNNLTTYMNELAQIRDFVVVILVGTKCDKRSDRKVSKTDNNIHALFKIISQLVYNQFIKSETPESEKDKPALQYDANRNRYYFHGSNNDRARNEGNQDNTPGPCIIL